MDNHFISLGGSCAVAFQLNNLNLRSISYPFDWCKITIKQLNSVLENDFKYFNELNIKKLSTNHSSIDNIHSSSYLLENKYKCKFAHELVNLDNLPRFQDKLLKRIHKFRNLKNPTFIRFENSKFYNNYQLDLQKLISNLKSIFNQFKLILIVPNQYKIIKIKYIHKIIYFNQFDHDWKYNKIKWDLIFL